MASAKAPKGLLDKVKKAFSSHEEAVTAAAASGVPRCRSHSTISRLRRLEKRYRIAAGKRPAYVGKERVAQFGFMPMRAPSNIVFARHGKPSPADPIPVGTEQQLVGGKLRTARLALPRSVFKNKQKQPVSRTRENARNLRNHGVG